MPLCFPRLIEGDRPTGIFAAQGRSTPPCVSDRALGQTVVYRSFAFLDFVFVELKPFGAPRRVFSRGKRCASSADASAGVAKSSVFVAPSRPPDPNGSGPRPKQMYVRQIIVGGASLSAPPLWRLPRAESVRTFGVAKKPERSTRGEKRALMCLGNSHRRPSTE